MVLLENTHRECAQIEKIQSHILTQKKIDVLHKSYLGFEREAAKYAKLIPAEIETYEKVNTELETVLIEQDNIVAEIASLNVDSLEEAKALMNVWFKLTMEEAGDEGDTIRDKIALSVFRYLTQ